MKKSSTESHLLVITKVDETAAASQQECQLPEAKNRQLRAVVEKSKDIFKSKIAR